jgi:hypothetical protein
MFWKVIVLYTVPANNATACGLEMVLLLKGIVDETYYFARLKGVARNKIVLLLDLYFLPLLIPATHSNAAEDAVEFAAYLVKTCVIDDAGVSNTEFYNVIEALGKVGYYTYSLLVLKVCVPGW